MIGQTISHYKILEKLGEGGMGIVYKAQDTKLDRLVALKFLPSHLTSSDSERARFVQEAKAASALNHPNVCTIHDIQDCDGMLFIVMELVEGQTLRDLVGAIHESHLPAKRAIEIGIQIAEGLAAAHEKGIVHRDIKPENIMVRKDGTAQIMDFGLAKLRGVSRLTKEGSTIGTAGYMSPEQIQGLDVDHRSDIFSLGVLLYELFTGELPFKGVHETALLYEIVNVDAVPMSALKSEIDPELDRIVLECLDKDMNERAQSAKQVAIDLKRFKRTSTRQHVSRITTARPAIATASLQRTAPQSYDIPPSTNSKREIIAWTLAGLAIALALFLIFRPSSNNPGTRQLIHSSVVTPESIFVQSYGTASGRPTLSPDGKLLAFKGILPDGSAKIFVRALDEKEARPIPGTEEASNPFWSPDGKMLGFFADDGKMKKVDLSGGGPTTIATVPNDRGATWGRNDIIVYCPDYQSGLFKVNADGRGQPQPVTTLDTTRNEGSHRWPFFLPDGKHFLYLARTAVESGEAEGDAIFVGSVDGTVKKMLVQSSFNAGYANGYLFFARNQVLMAQRFDVENLSLSGDAMKVEDDLLNDPSYNIAAFTLSDNGLLLYQPGTTIGAGARPILVNRTGAVARIVGDNLIEQDQPRFSPDGKQIAMYMYDLRSRRSNVWIFDLQTNSRRRLTTNSRGDFFPIWSRDGSTIYFTSGGVFNSDVYRRPVSHAGREEMVYASPKADVATDISPDGSILLLETRDARRGDSQSDIFFLPLNGSKKDPIPFQTTKFHEHDGRFSHDGKWIAFVSDESGVDEIYVKSVRQSDALPFKISSGGGNTPTWGMGVNELVYVNNQFQMVAVTLRLQENFVNIENAKILFRVPPFVLQYDLSPDGNTFVFSRFIEMGKLSPLSLVVNWESALQR